MFNTKLILLIQILQIELTITMPFYINLNLQHCESVILQKCGYGIVRMAPNFMGHLRK